MRPVFVGLAGLSAVIYFAIVLTGFVLLTVWRARPLAVVIFGALGGIILASAHL